MKYFLSILISLLFLSCSEEKPVSTDMTRFIPGNAALILKMENPDLFFSNLKNNTFLRENKNNPLSEYLKNRLSFFEYFPHNKKAYLSFSLPEKGGLKYLFISKGIPEIVSLDSVKNKKVVSQNLDGLEITAYTLEGKTTYTGTKNEVFLMSNSRELLVNSLQESGETALNSIDFEKALKAASEESPTILINHKNIDAVFKKLFPGQEFDYLKTFSNWTALDLEIEQRSLKLNGITTATDTVPKLINVFKGVNPVENKLAAMVPGNSIGFLSITYENFSVLHKNLLHYKGKAVNETTSETQNLLKTTLEAGIIYLGEHRVLVLRAIDPEVSKRIFASGKETVETFRGTRIYEISDSGKFNRIFQPLLNPGKLNYFLFLNDFILFSEKKQALKEVVKHVQNETVLANSKDFLATMEKLSTEASILLVSNNEKFQNILAENVAEEYRNEVQNLIFEGFPSAALQFIYSDDFAHVHALLEKTTGATNEAGISQEALVTLDADLAAPPVFFNNHRTNGLDIAVQDANNTLYLISKSGKIFWKKDLDFRILGKIKQVDLYRNGRIQLAFATPHAIHIIDRDGNKVPPFPLEFDDEITLPLAVFDYDSNRKYRFLVVQGKEVFMYNSQGERVKGFTFTEGKNEIIKVPKHIRLGTKDYILIAEESGKLNILSRTGKIRVPVEEYFNFSKNEWYEYENQFISTNSEGELLKIDQEGNISTSKLKASPETKIAGTAHTLVSLSENNLTINDKTISLDYGLYTQPQIFYHNDKIYVSVTDTQSHRVFLFDGNAQIIPGFPVYGNSKIDFGNADSDANLELVVQGEENSFIVYEIETE